MPPRRLLFVAACLMTLGTLARTTPVFAADDTPRGPADQRFDKLLAEAMKSPEKADWKAIREAFAETSYYQPYSIEVDEKLKEISKAIGRGEIKDSEAALLRLLERDKYMRFDTVAMLMILYQKTDQPEKAGKYKKILDGILGVLNYPKSGTSFENSIEILFIQEEYLVTTNMPVKGRGTSVHDGLRFDVFEIEADGDEAARKVYFNIELPRKSLSKSLKDLK